MSDFREEEALGKAYDSQLMRRLMTYLRPYKWRVVFAVFLTLLVGPLEVVGPYLFGYGVDKFIIPGSNYSLAASAALRGVALVSLGFLAALLLSFAVQYLQVRIMQDVGQLTLYDLRRDIFERLQRLPMSFYDRSPVGRLVTRVTTDVDALNDLFAAGATLRRMSGCGQVCGPRCGYAGRTSLEACETRAGAVGANIAGDSQ